MTRSIVDAHAHVWDRSKHPQPWIDPSTMAVIDRDFAVADLLDAEQANGVASVVIVQTSNSLSETEDLLAAAGPDAAQAIVGWVDLASPSVADSLDHLREGVNGGKLRGIRHLAHTEADPDWLARDAVSYGLGALGARGLAFDLVVRPEQLPVSRDVVRRHPEVRFVLDHLGKPPIAGGRLTDWERALRALAAEPNVSAKLSGLTIEARWSDWVPAEIEQVLDIAIDAFGPARLMFGSDWPLVELSDGYSAWLETYLAWSGALSVDEQSRIDSGTAHESYVAR